MKTLVRLVAFTLATSTPFALMACDTSDPTAAVIDNGYPAPPDGGEPSMQTVVLKAWWSVTIFSDPTPAGAESDAHRIVPGNETAYAILAPGWDPASTTPPPVLIPVRSKDKLTVARGATLHIKVDDATFTGNCAAGGPLTQDDADFITQRIFPGDFAAVTYDAKTCTSTPRPADGGVDAAPD